MNTTRENEAPRARPEGNPYRSVLEQLALSRGLSGAEELAAQAAAIDPKRTAAEFLDPTRGGQGVALAKVLDLSVPEKARIASAYAQTYFPVPNR
jgi:hypothetical protein